VSLINYQKMLSEKAMIAILAAVLIGVIIYYCHSSSGASSKETFLAAGSMTHLGTVLPDGRLNDYELISGGVAPSLDSALQASDFAGLVDSGDQAIQAPTYDEATRPLERLQNLSDSYFPTIASKALPFSQNAAKPLYHSHAVNLPRVNMKGKLYEMNLAEAVRGTVAINYDPNVALIASSQYRNEDVFNSGYMTGAMNSLYNKLTGSNKNMPLYIEGNGQSVGVGGMGVEAIYDF
jgi:hypothetical protein